MTDDTRKVLLVTVGSETWEPSPDELEQVLRLFQQADRDRNGSVMVVRDGIEVDVTDMTKIREIDIPDELAAIIVRRKDHDAG